MLSLGERIKIPSEKVDLFWSKVDKSGECWLWTKATQKGYGVFWVPPQNRRAHVVAYNLLVGPVPEGLDLDHLCRVRHCVNPSHLEPVTRKENVLRGETRAAENAAKTHCVRGHPFDDENTRISPKGLRICRECGRDRMRLRETCNQCGAEMRKNGMSRHMRRMHA